MVRGTKEILEALARNEVLTEAQAKDTMLQIGRGEVNTSQISSFLSMYMMRPVSIDELIGFQQALIELSNKVDLSEFKVFDVVGTGGDGKNTFNISTTTMFIVAGAGIYVAKHGNHGASSVSGSATVLEALGVKFTNDEQKLKRCLEKSHVCFLFAPLFHPAMKHVANCRKELKVPTIFNFIGPLVNPAQPEHGLIGVYNLQIFRLYNYIQQKKRKNHIIVHSLDGYDEVSLTSQCKVASRERELTLDASDFGFAKVLPEELLNGGSATASANTLLNILKGTATEAQTHVALANAALVIQADRLCSLIDAVHIAKEALKSGKALKSLETFLEYSKE